MKDKTNENEPITTGDPGDEQIEQPIEAVATRPVKPRKSAEELREEIEKFKPHVDPPYTPEEVNALAAFSEDELGKGDEDAQVDPVPVAEPPRLTERKFHVPFRSLDDDERRSLVVHCGHEGIVYDENPHYGHIFLTLLDHHELPQLVANSATPI